MQSEQGDGVRSRFDAASTATDVTEGVDLKGRVAIVTGGAAGIGRAIVAALAEAGAEVLIGDVDQEASAQAVAELGAKGLRVGADRLDLASLASVRDFAARYARSGRALDILINNAGVMAPPTLRRTADGHELQFGINHLGHFLLTTELERSLRAAGRARVVCVSSIAHRRSDVIYDDPDYRERPYDRWEAYGQSKTACALMAVAANERWGASGIVVNAINPGGSMTGLQRFMTDEELRAQGWLDADGKVPNRWRSPEQCAATSVWVATDPDLAEVGGRYFENCAEADPWRAEEPMRGVRPYALSKENADRLWTLSEQLVGTEPMGARSDAQSG